MSKAKTVRQDLGERLNEKFSGVWLDDFLETVKGMTNGAWGSGICEECGSKRKVLVQVPDIKGQLAALVALMEQSEGRPGTAQGEAGGVTLIVERKWPDAGSEDLDKLRDAPAPAGISSI